ncbi:MAG: hypothetical protein WCA16_13885 [Candidatus Sulfotelmatobacter sp.]
MVLFAALQRLKARWVVPGFTARLKACPDTNHKLMAAHRQLIAETHELMAVHRRLTAAGHELAARIAS